MCHDKVATKEDGMEVLSVYHHGLDSTSGAQDKELTPSEITSSGMYSILYPQSSTWLHIPTYKINYVMSEVSPPLTNDVE